ncbi:hypothetical protein ACIQGZ_19130 [Streptomyces sp. NPDC092296]|uniref:hypothetical protein n=1 Tax=Streptomyces sp. NPDC092296 TaxID=3366012 RepID=UPI003801935D
MNHRNPGDSEAASALAAVHPHTRGALLSAISTDGVLALTRALRDADLGDETAATAPVSSLLRALPGMGALTAHELLRSAHIKEHDQVRDLHPDQRAALVQIISHLEPPHPHPLYPEG